MHTRVMDYQVNITELCAISVHDSVATCAKMT